MNCKLVSEKGNRQFFLQMRTNFTLPQTRPVTQRMNNEDLLDNGPAVWETEKLSTSPKK